MRDEERAIFAGALADVTGEMWRAAVPSPRTTGAVAAQVMVASIGLAGPCFRGALVLRAAPAFFRAVYPPELRKSALTTSEVFDWAGEMANQLLGRMKNRLARLGLDFHLSTPTVVMGDRLRLGLGRFAATPIAHGVAVAGAPVEIFFEIVHDEGKALLPATGPVMVASLEGEGLLF